MKHVKKLAGFFLALMLTAAMVLPAMAADITIEGGMTRAQYDAYRLLNLTTSQTAGGTTNYAYTVHSKYETALQSVTGETAAEEIIAYIEQLKGGEAIRTFADQMFAQVKALEPDVTTSTNAFLDVAQGYYLIAEKQTGGGADEYSLVMLDTAGEENVTIHTKESVPTLTKKVQEKNDSTGTISKWQDGADYDIGDAVPFRLTGTVSRNYGSYKTYYYAFHDKMSQGLTFLPESVEVFVDGQKIESHYQVKQDCEDGCSFEVIFENLKRIGEVRAGSSITVDFMATLNERAVIGSAGNPNEAKLEFSNSPYDTSKKGETPMDKVIVFTYQLIANKVDKNKDPLKGAGFTLYKWDKDESDYVAVGSEIEGADVTEFEFQGTDAGRYKLVETTVPAGYNKAEDLEFMITAEYDTDKIEPKFLRLNITDLNGNPLDGDGGQSVFTVDINSGSAKTSIVNKAGSELPSTGGMGTMLFYVAGGILVLAAVVLLFAGKHTSSKEKL